MDPKKFLANFKSKFELYEIEKIAKETGFVKRKPRKITPSKLLISLFLTLFNGTNTHSNLE